MQEGEEERKDSSKGIWLVLIWKYCFTSSELNYWPEPAVLREQAVRHRQPRWARSGQQICDSNHGERMNPWSAELWSCPFIQWIKSVSLLFLGSDFILRGRSLWRRILKIGESYSLSFFVPFPAISVALCMCIIKRPKDNRRWPVIVKY